MTATCDSSDLLSELDERTHPVSTCHYPTDDVVDCLSPGNSSSIHSLVPVMCSLGQPSRPHHTVYAFCIGPSRGELGDEKEVRKQPFEGAQGSEACFTKNYTGL